MEIFHMSFSNISAGKGRSAIASAAYRSGEKLFDDKEGRRYFYARSVIPESFILTPKNAPEWASDREKLWNEVEKNDRKSNSRYAKEFNVALPVELSESEQKELLTKYVQENFVDQGMVADVAIHRDHSDNPHAHVMLTNRHIIRRSLMLVFLSTSFIPSNDKMWSRVGINKNQQFPPLAIDLG